MTDAPGNPRKLDSRAKKGRHHEVAQPVQMDLLVETGGDTESPEPAARWRRRRPPG